MTISIGAVSGGWSWLEIAQITLPPFVALFSAICLFFAQRRSDREQHLREKRSVIYAEYLSVLMDRNVSRASVSATDFFEQANRLTNLHSLIVVVAPKDVVQASKKMFGAALVRGMERANAKEPDIDVDADKSVLENYLANHSDLKKLGERDQEFHDAYQKLVTTMRSDLLSGTKVDNFLADEAFANKALS